MLIKGIVEGEKNHDRREELFRGPSMDSNLMGGYSPLGDES